MKKKIIAAALLILAGSTLSGCALLNDIPNPILPGVRNVNPGPPNTGDWYCKVPAGTPPPKFCPGSGIPPGLGPTG